MYNKLVSAGFPSEHRSAHRHLAQRLGRPAHPTAITSTSTPNTYVAANKIDQRPFRGDWCNQNGAGIGARPQADPYGSSTPSCRLRVDQAAGRVRRRLPHRHATPTATRTATRTAPTTDGNGGTYPTDAIPGFDVPAGQWFPAEFQLLVQNAYPAL